MYRSIIILAFLLLLTKSAQTQSFEKDLLSKTWFSQTNLNVDSLVLSADNSTNPKYEIRFASSGRLYVKQIKTKSLDSSFTYVVQKKNVLRLEADRKDSVKTAEYQLKKLKGEKGYELRRKLSTRYVQRKGDAGIIEEHFTLVSGKKRKTIRSLEEIAVFSENRALHNDSINRAVWGAFAGYVEDTLLIDSDEFIEHNFYKKHTDSLHFIAPLIFDTLIRVKVPVRDITGIYSSREPLGSITTKASIGALVLGFVCIATSVAAGGSDLGTAAGKVGIISLLTIPVSFGTGLLYSKQKFHMKKELVSEKKRKRTAIWHIERHMPHTIITQHGKVSGKKR